MYTIKNKTKYPRAYAGIGKIEGGKSKIVKLDSIAFRFLSRDKNLTIEKVKKRKVVQEKTEKKLKKNVNKTKTKQAKNNN